MADKSFDRFILQEGLRQDALVHNVGSQLGTKNGLFMVFAAFIFTAESTLVGAAPGLGLQLPHWPLAVSLVLALVGIGILLWSARLQSYRMPPVLAELRSQSEKFFELADIKGLPEEEQMDRLGKKFSNSLARSITENQDANRRIAKNLQTASVFVGLSLACLFGSLAWTAGRLLCASAIRRYLLPF
jgi:hypothetical protein